MDLGEVKWILGMHVARDWGRCLITLSHQRYIETILERFGFENSHPVSTPMDPNTSLPLLTEAEVDVTDYQSRVGSLIHAVVCSHFDIAQAVGAIARHASKPGQIHLNAVNCIFRYLCGTSDHVLIYDGNVGSAEPTVYSDANWAGDRNDCKSTSGLGLPTVPGTGTAVWKTVHRRYHPRTRRAGMPPSYSAVGSGTGDTWPYTGHGRLTGFQGRQILLKKLVQLMQENVVHIH